MLARIALSVFVGCAAVSVIAFAEWCLHAQYRWRDTRAHHNAIDFGHRYDDGGITQWGCNRKTEGLYHCEGYMIIPRKGEPMNMVWLKARGCILKEAL